MDIRIYKKVGGDMEQINKPSKLIFLDIDRLTMQEL